MALNPPLLPERLNPLPVNDETFILWRKYMSSRKLHPRWASRISLAPRETNSLEFVLVYCPPALR